MKRILMAAAMLAVPAVASAASLPAATGSTATHSITLNGRVTAQCVATGTSSVNFGRVGEKLERFDTSTSAVCKYKEYGVAVTWRKEVCLIAFRRSLI